MPGREGVTLRRGVTQLSCGSSSPRLRGGRRQNRPNITASSVGGSNPPVSYYQNSSTSGVPSSTSGGGVLAAAESSTSSSLSSRRGGYVGGGYSREGSSSGTTSRRGSDCACSSRQQQYCTGNTDGSERMYSTNPSSSSWVEESGEASVIECPVCLEPMDETDLKLFPCLCGYQICLWCLQKIRDSDCNKCPICRREYDESQFRTFETVPPPTSTTGTGSTKKKSPPSSAEHGASSSSGPVMGSTTENPPTAAAGGVSSGRRTVAAGGVSVKTNRILQLNLCYITGIPDSIAKNDILSDYRFFGKYGKINSLVLHPHFNKKDDNNSVYSYSAFICFATDESCSAAILDISKLTNDNEYAAIRAYCGTTKYCSMFLRGLPCTNEHCAFIHRNVPPDQNGDRILRTKTKNPSSNYDQRLVQLINSPSQLESLFACDRSKVEQKHHHHHQIPDDSGSGSISSASNDTVIAKTNATVVVPSVKRKWGATTTTNMSLVNTNNNTLNSHSSSESVLLSSSAQTEFPSLDSSTTKQRKPNLHHSVTRPLPEPKPLPTPREETVSSSSSGVDDVPPPPRDTEEDVALEEVEVPPPPDIWLSSDNPPPSEERRTWGNRDQLVPNSPPLPQEEETVVVYPPLMTTDDEQPRNDGDLIVSSSSPADGGGGMTYHDQSDCCYGGGPPPSNNVSTFQTSSMEGHPSSQMMMGDSIMMGPYYQQPTAPPLLYNHKVVDPMGGLLPSSESRFHRWSTKSPGNEPELMTMMSQQPPQSSAHHHQHFLSLLEQAFGSGGGGSSLNVEPETQHPYSPRLQQPTGTSDHISKTLAAIWKQQQYIPQQPQPSSYNYHPPSTSNPVNAHWRGYPNEGGNSSQLHDSQYYNTVSSTRATVYSDNNNNNNTSQGIKFLQSLLPHANVQLAGNSEQQQQQQQHHHHRGMMNQGYGRCPIQQHDPGNMMMMVVMDEAVHPHMRSSEEVVHSRCDDGSG